MKGRQDRNGNCCTDGMALSNVQFIILAGFSFTIHVALAADAPPAAETPMKDPVITMIKTDRSAGEVVTLIEQDPSAWAVSLNSHRSPALGTVILIHDLGGHADAPRVVASLRRQLPAAGWSTLSVTMPKLRDQPLAGTAEELFKSTQTVIDAAITKVRAQNPATVALIGYGLGAVVAAHYLANKANHGFAGWVAIAMPVDKTPFPELFVPDYLKKITIPVLDIFGQNDHDRVVTTAAERAQASANARPAPAKNKPDALMGYRQDAILGADHEFTGMNELLAKRVSTWLGRYLTGAATKQAP